MVLNINNTNRIVSGKGFCPVCGQNKSWSYPQDNDPSFPSFVICYGSAPAQYGWKYCGDTDSGGSKYIRKSDQNSPPALIKHQLRPKSDLAPIEIRDQVYRALLSRCPLERKHRRQIKRREFSKDQHKRMEEEPLGSLGGYRGRTKLIRSMCEFGDIGYDNLAGVPGFYINDYGSWTLAGSPGLLIPVLDPQGRIQALQIRPDEPIGNAKYIWMSSNNREEQGGTGSGAPAGIIYPEGWDFRRPITSICMTEGYFKALALVAVEKTPVIWVAGVGMFHAALELLRQLGSPENIILFYDLDWRTNPKVRKALIATALALQSYRPGFLTKVNAIGWDSKYGKGIDDALLKGKMPYDLELYKRFELSIDLERLQASLDCDIKSSHLKTDLDKLPFFWEPVERVAEEEVRERTKESCLEAFASKAGTFSFISAGTGGGKTYICIHHAPKQTLFVFPNYKMLMEKHEELEAQGKNVGIFYGRQQEPSPPEPEASQEQWKEYFAEQRRFEAAGCLQYEQASQAGEANHNPCAGCKLFEYHHQPLLNPDKEEACRYWPHREAIESNLPDYLLMMPQTLLHHSHLMEHYNFVIIDDVPNFDLLLCNKIALTLENLQEWLEHPQTHELSEPIIAFLRLLKQSIELSNKKGWTHDNLKEAASEALEALREKLREKKANKKAKMAPCEQPFAQGDEGQEELIHPQKRLQQLLETIALGRPYQLTQSSIEWLDPHKKAIQALKEKTTLFLDATPRLSYWLQTLPALGFQVEAPDLPRIFPKLVQLCDRLYSKDQIETKRPFLELLLEKLGPEVTALFSFKGMFEQQDGHFGRDERGLNQFSGQGFQQMLLAGHHQMSEADAKNYAWCLRSFAKHMGIAPPTATFKEGEKPDKQGRVLRRYSDPLRPFERRCYRCDDPLAEEIRRHHNTSSILQAASRLRDALLLILVASGEPLDGLHYEVPVRLITEKELAITYDLPLPSDQKALNAALSERNVKRQKDAELRFEDYLQKALGLIEEKKCLPSQNELRLLLAEEGHQRISSELAKRVLEHLSNEQSWAFLKDSEDIEAQGEEGPCEKIGSGEPHFVLINSIKGGVRFTPNLKSSEPILSLETQADETPSKVTASALWGGEEIGFSVAKVALRREGLREKNQLWRAAQLDVAFKICLLTCLLKPRRSSSQKKQGKQSFLQTFCRRQSLKPGPLQVLKLWQLLRLVQLWKQRRFGLLDAERSSQKWPKLHIDPGHGSKSGKRWRLAHRSSGSRYGELRLWVPMNGALRKIPRGLGALRKVHYPPHLEVHMGLASKARPPPRDFVGMVDCHPPTSAYESIEVPGGQSRGKDCHHPPDPLSAQGRNPPLDPLVVFLVIKAAPGPRLRGLSPRFAFGTCHLPFLHFLFLSQGGKIPPLESPFCSNLNQKKQKKILREG